MNDWTAHLAGIEIVPNPALRPGEYFFIDRLSGPVFMHPDALEHLRAELGPGTYAERCRNHELVRYRRRQREMRARKAGLDRLVREGLASGAFDAPGDS